MKPTELIKKIGSFDEFFPRAAAVIAVLIGSLVQVGWLFDIPALKTMVLGVVAMNPLTSIGFILSGCSLWLHLDSKDKLSRLFGVFVGGIGYICISRLFLWDLHVDQILFADQLGSNRMAPNTALAFILLGSALAAQDLHIGKRLRLADILAMASLLFGMVAVTGYIYGVGSLYGVKGFIPMAFMTGFTFVLLSLGILFTHPQDGISEILFRKDFGGRIARGLLPGVIMLPIFLGWLQVHGVRNDFYLPEVGSALGSVATMLILTGLVGWAAASLSRSQAVYHKHNQVLQSVLDCMNDAVIVVDAKGEIVLKNPSAGKMLEEMKQMKENESWQTPLQRAARGIETKDAEFSVSIPLLGARFLNVTGRTLKDEAEQSQGGVVVIRDMTEKKRQENSLMDAKVELEKQVQERIADLRKTELQVQQLQKMDAIGHLAGGVAHDFNNLLAAIQLYCDLIEEGSLDAEGIKKSIQEINNVTKRGAALTRQLLVFSRKQAIQLQPLRINELTTNLMTMLQRLIPANITIKTKFAEDVNQIMADAGQLEQVIMNLVVNARDAMPAGGNIIIETNNAYLDEDFTSTHLAVTPGHYMALTITDTGIGMDSATQARVFEPFFTTKPVGKGTGLGLATVYGIIKKMNGSIWLYSEVGKGTIFKIYLPADPKSAALQTRPINPSHSTNASGTILVVEDEDKLRTLFAATLKKRGFTVLEAKNGLQALEVCRRLKGTVDLILTDVIMPEMGGFELVRKVRELYPEAKVLFMSGYADESLRSHDELKDDEIPFIQKPFDSPSLAAKIKATLENKVAS